MSSQREWTTHDKPKKGRFVKNFLRDRYLWLLALPAVLALIAFHYLPMFGIVIAFQKMDYGKGILGSPLVGFENFKFLFRTTDAWVITRNTIGYNIVFILTGTLCALLFSLILTEIRPRIVSKTLQTILIMPHFLSWAVVAILVFAFLSPQNGFLSRLVLQLTGRRINYYLTPSFWPGFLVFLNLWKGVGYSSIVYLASISGISKEYYESAMLDGANKRQQALYITIPHLRAMITILLIMAIGGIMRGDFGLFYLIPMNSGVLFPVTNVIDTYIYRGLMELGNPNMTAAAGLYQSVIGFLLVLFANWFVRRLDPENSMF